MYLVLTHWGRVTHVCVGNLAIIGSDNGLSPGRRQAITWTNVGILLIGPLGTNFNELLIAIHTFSYKKILFENVVWKMAAICLGLNVLTHWGRVTHICVSYWTIIGSDNGLSPGRHQAIIWTNAGILLIRTLGTNFSEILSEIHKFSLKKMHLKTSPGKWRPFCLGLNMLTPFLFLIRVSISLFDLLVLWKEMQMTTYTVYPKKYAHGFCFALLWLYIDWFSHIHQAYFTGTVAI